MSTRAPPPGPPPRYTIVQRVYTHNLRPVVIGIASITALWALFDFIGYFRSIGIARQSSSRLGTFSIILGAFYTGIFVIETFGIFAAVTQRLPLVRAYAMLSIGSALLFAAAGLTRVVVHFIAKTDIINECTGAAEGSTVVTYPFGFFGPSHHDFIDHDDAVNWCTNAWDHDSWADIVGLIISLILAGIFTMVAFAYYRQVLDPSSPANVSRVAPGRFGAPPSHYNPPYNAAVPNLGYGYSMPYSGGPTEGYNVGNQYAPPPGPPPAAREGHDAKPPDYLGGQAGYGNDKPDDPFADFEDTGRQERDVTSRPGPGGRETF
ncbi:hypothetical protein C8J56DRAFT_557847 [Mycena floridula]|nr:hypothetical protein C8J56DRAFT_557847 [Mycena floridula]